MADTPNSEFDREWREREARRLRSLRRLARGGAIEGERNAAREGARRIFERLRTTRQQRSRERQRNRGQTNQQQIRPPPTQTQAPTNQNQQPPPRQPRIRRPPSDFFRTPSPYGRATWIIVIIAILIAILFLLTNPLGFVSFLGPFWMVILAAIGIGIVLFSVARGKNVDFFALLGQIFLSIWNFIKKHWKLIVLIISGLLIFFYVAGPILGTGISGILSVLASSTGLRWIIAGVLAAFALYLIFKKKGEKYPYRTLGIVILVASLFFGWLFGAIYPLIVGTLADLFGLRWIVTLILVGLGIILLFTKSKAAGVFLIVLGIAFWFVVPFFSSALFEKYGLQGEIAVEEAGIGKRLERFWFYVQNPEQYFAKFGEFTNPQAKEKKALVGLQIVKFESVVNTFRSDQEVRLTAEVKNYALPKFEFSRGIEESKVSSEFYCNATSEDDKFVNGQIEIRSSVGTERETNVIPFVDPHRNSTFFVFCNFKEGEIKPAKGKNETTQKATLSASYTGFVTESVLKTYILGKTKYNEINSRENRDAEFLNELRSSASYPGLINNERKTISEYSSGPVKLSVNILNEQPLTSEDEYTLIVRSEPNSIDWEGNIKVKDIFLEVPSWFSLDQDKCDFEGSGKLQLKVNDKERILSACEGKESVGTGCNFFCDFKVVGKENVGNIEEYNIRAVQVTDYTVRKSTTFGLAKSYFVGDEKESEQEPEKEERSVIKEETESVVSGTCGNRVIEEAPLGEETGEECVPGADKIFGVKYFDGIDKCKEFGEEKGFNYESGDLNCNNCKIDHSGCKLRENLAP